MQPIKPLPRHYAKIACEKLSKDGYEFKPYDIYNVAGLNPFTTKSKVIRSVLYGLAVNEYQKLNLKN